MPLRLPIPGRNREPDADARSAPPAPVDPAPRPDPAGAPGVALAKAGPAEWAVPRGVRTASDWAWRVLVIGAAVYAVLRLLGFLSEVVIPVVVALLLAALLRPVARGLGRHLPPGLAAGVTVVGTLALITGLLSFVGSQFSGQFSDILDQTTKGIDEIREWLRTTFHVSDTQVGHWIDTAKSELTSGQSNLGQTAAHAGLTATHALAGFFVALFALFFFLYEGDRIWAWVVRLCPLGTRARVHSSGLIAWGQLSAFTRATVMVAAVDATVIGTGAAILRVPFASGIAVLIFFGAFIPVVGAFVSGTVAVLLALVALGPIQALVMLGVVVGTMQLESHVLQPFLLGRAVRVHPLSVILGIAAGIITAGIVGALIAVPLIAVLNAVGHHLLDADEASQGDPDALTSPRLGPAEAAAAQELLDDDQAARASGEAAGPDPELSGQD
jgi:predicted PurR-regulated permease PerM